MKTLTIKDIAAALNLSISTVSRALNNHPDIADGTKHEVMAFAREHHYRPNQLASSLRTQRNNTIGVLLPEITVWFFATLLAGIEKAANEAGYNVLITRSKEDVERESSCMHTLFGARVAGIIVCPSCGTTDFTQYNDIIDSGIPLVIVDRLSPVNCDQVVSDDYHGAFQAVEYMIQTGYRSIHIFHSTPSAAIRERQRGWREALEKYNLSFDDSFVHEVTTRDGAIREAAKMFNGDKVPDAVFCTNDKLADGVVYVAKMKKIAIPEQLAVCGFSNNNMTTYTDPMQTTVEQYAEEIGRHSMERLLLRIQNHEDTTPPATIVIPTDLIVRETTK